MSEQPRSVAEDWRDVRGWVPWLFAGVYFPLYVGLDLVAGDTIAAGTGLPRSVSVAAFSLAVALGVTAAVTVSQFESVTWFENVSALEDVSLSLPSDGLDLGDRFGTGDRSTVGSTGAIDRKSVRTSTSGTESLKGSADVAAASPDGGTDAGDETEEWPDEWIPADKL